MPIYPISRPRRRPLRAALGALRIPGGANLLGGGLIVAWILICGMLALVPRWWIAERIDRAQREWFEGAHSKASRLTQEWEHWTLGVPDFVQGDEEAIRTWLRTETLVEAVVDLVEGRLWIREKGHLRRPASAEEARLPAEWVRKALEQYGRKNLNPDREGTPKVAPLALKSDAGIWWHVPYSNLAKEEGAGIVTFNGRWCLIKRWTPGSPEVENWLRATLRAQDDYRFGVLNGIKFGTAIRRTRRFEDFGPPRPPTAPPTKEVRELSAAPFFEDVELGHSFSGYRYVVLQMLPGTFQRLWSAHVLRQRMAWLGYGLGVGLSGMALLLYLFSRHRERLQADRVAALAHSLKTPLAVLQSRCDTIQNEGLPQEIRQAQLLKIGSEVRHLTRLIESGLEETRTRGAGTAEERISGPFLESIDEELSPAFESRGRLLEVYSAGLDFRARAASLRTALVTLLENALLHGEGTVVLKAIQEGDRITCSVEDEGPGLPAELARSLLEDRLSKDLFPAIERMPGQKLGLRMLRNLARDEGWGLVLENLEPGFRASLEIRC